MLYNFTWMVIIVIQMNRQRNSYAPRSGNGTRLLLLNHQHQIDSVIQVQCMSVSQDRVGFSYTVLYLQPR